MVLSGNQLGQSWPSSNQTRCSRSTRAGCRDVRGAGGNGVEFIELIWQFPSLPHRVFPGARIRVLRVLTSSFVS